MRGQLSAVDVHAVALHFKQHLGNGQFQIQIHFKLFFVHLRAQMRFKAQGEIRVLRGVFGGLLDGDIGKGNLLRALTAQGFVSNRRQAEPAFGQFVQTVPQMALDNIRSQHRIARNAAQRNAVVGKNVLVVFQILADFFQAAVFQIGFQTA